MSQWGTSAEEFVGKWQLIEGTPEFEIKAVSLTYYDATTPEGAEVSFDSSAGQLNIVGKCFAFKADGFVTNGEKKVLVVNSTIGAPQAVGNEIPTEGERYEHEEI